MATSIDPFCCEIENITKLWSYQSDTEPDWDSLLREFRTVETRLKDQLNRDKVPESLFSCVREILEVGSKRLESAPRIAPVLAQCFRCLRNACANSSHNQELISRQRGILETTYCICQHLKSKLSCTDCILIVRCAIQFLGNFIVRNKKNQEDVWRGLKPVFRGFVSCNDEKLPHYTCMVLHTCLSGLLGERCEVEEYLMTDTEGKDLVIAVLNSFQNDGSEWMLFVVEDLLSAGSFWDSLGRSVTAENKLAVLEVACQMLGNPEEMKNVCPESNLVSVAHEFIVSAHDILELKHQSDTNIENARLVLKELEVLCLATSHAEIYPEIRNDRLLLSTALGLLQCVHHIGKTGNNVFSSITKVTQSDRGTDEVVNGLKRDLIRLIGNMVYKTPENQNLVRELDGIPLILDQTKIDERNPFITQWSVLAIRNLCEDNEANKALIAGLKLEGLSDSASALRDFGVEAEVRGDKVVIKNLSKP